MKPYYFFCLLFLLGGCNSDTADNNAAQKALPNTPETVARQWQEYIDTDKFDEATELSTARGKEWINLLKKFIEGLPIEETAAIIQTTFTEMNCIEEGDFARCGYILEEEGELIKDTFYLNKVNGQWLVDIPEEVTEGIETEMEGFVDSLILK